MAGSDPTGGAGLQLDLKVFAELGADGAAVPAVLTVQSAAAGLEEAEPVPAELVRRMLEAVLRSGPVAAVKTGALGRAETVWEVAEVLERHPQLPLIVDPVIQASRALAGAQLLEPKALHGLREQLLPRATLITPNLEEASLLAGSPVGSREDMLSVAEKLAGLGPAVLLTGGHLDPEADEVEDLLVQPGRAPVWLTHARVPGGDRVHGTGCALSAAITALVGGGAELESAVRRARRHVGEWIAAARGQRLAPRAS